MSNIGDSSQVQRAREFLAKHNVSISENDDPVQVAIKHAQEIVINKHMPAKGEFIGVDCYSDYDYDEDTADENETNCKGWDGESRRCDCGNRRWGWDVYPSDSFDIDKMFAYPVTY